MRRRWAEQRQHTSDKNLTSSDNNPENNADAAIAKLHFSDDAV